MVMSQDLSLDIHLILLWQSLKPSIVSLNFRGNQENNDDDKETKKKRKKARMMVLDFTDTKAVKVDVDTTSNRIRGIPG